MTRRIAIISVLILGLLISGCSAGTGKPAEVTVTPLPTKPEGDVQPGDDTGPEGEPTDVLLNTAFELAVGQQAYVAPADMTITFVEVVEESRCPIEAECVWAGQAVVKLDVEYAGQDVGEITLTLSADQSGGEAVFVQGYTIEITDLLPEPSLNSSGEDIRAVLVVYEGEKTGSGKAAKDRPPVFYLQVGQQQIAGKPGTFCWPVEAKGIICQDVFTPPALDAYIPLFRDSTIQLQIDAPHPDHVIMELFSTETYQGRPTDQSAALSTELPVKDGSVIWEDVSVPDGTYILVAAGYWSETQADAVYYFGVEIGEGETVEDNLQPPPLVLSIGEQQLEAVMGSYCWGPAPQEGQPAQPGICADLIPPEFETYTLIPAGKQVVFNFVDPLPDRVQIKLSESVMDDSVGGVVEAILEGPSLAWDYSDIQPGQYILSVFAKWDARGDAIYFFAVEIE